MKLTPTKLNRFLMVKLPSAWLCGVRVKNINMESCTVKVRHRWINQNPFNSMYFAVQAMAAELSTGAMVIAQIQNSGKKISMLVAQNKASFSKKATGKLEFTCNDGHKIKEAIEQTIKSGEGQTFWMTSEGINEDGIIVSTFEFEWTVRLKQKKQ